MTKVSCDMKKCNWNKDGECSRESIEIHEFNGPLGVDIVCMCVYISENGITAEPINFDKMKPGTIDTTGLCVTDMFTGEIITTKTVETEKNTNLMSFNLIEIIENKYGPIPGTAEDKIKWLKDNVKVIDKD